MRKAEGLLKEAEQKKAELVREAEQIKREAEEEAERVVAEGQRELEVLMRRRADINQEISRVQDVLEALEGFESQPAGKAAPGGSGTGVKAGASAGSSRSGGKQNES
ncbi:hypothetical protein SF12_21530 [Streptomyces sp. MBRL 601]|nr:hypothetical protein SF12_21530 [Streptomyces sp. MBRL 601]